MPEVRQTPLATSRVAGLRGPNLRAYNAFLDALAHEGCAAMGYRLTGPVIERLCVKHVRGRLRAVVAFSLDDVAWVLLVGEHLNDAEVNVYDELYRLVGHRPEPGEKRTKPPCCNDSESTQSDAFGEDEVVELVARMRRVAQQSRR